MKLAKKKNQHITEIQTWMNFFTKLQKRTSPEASILVSNDLRSTKKWVIKHRVY